jgi:hypothetical protein
MIKKNKIPTPAKKVSYRVTNWKEYNQALINRGDFTIFISEDYVGKWYSKARSNGVGRPLVYSDISIKIILTLRELFKLPLRQITGLVKALFVKLVGANIRIPYYTQVCRRAKTLKIRMAKKIRGGKVELFIDSTGLKIGGEGEWKTRIHGKNKRRKWRKFHILMDGGFQIVEGRLTTSTVGDCTILPGLLRGKEKISTIYGDGAYSSKKCFEAIAKTGASPQIALSNKIKVVRGSPPGEGSKLRNELAKEIKRSGGKNKWKKTSNYHRRSLVETQMKRLKTIFPPTLSSKKFANQVTEVGIRVMILNKFTSLGMPNSVKI